MYIGDGVWERAEDGVCVGEDVMASLYSFWLSSLCTVQLNFVFFYVNCHDIYKDKTLFLLYVLYFWVVFFLSLLCFILSSIRFISFVVYFCKVFFLLLKKIFLFIEFG